MARQRRNSEADEENLERWMVSYADFITLLFAFFVVMYAISSVNEGKYRVLSAAMLEAFSPGTMQTGADVIELGGVASEGAMETDNAELLTAMDLPAAAMSWDEPADSRLRQTAGQTTDVSVIKQRIKQMAGRLQQTMAALVEQELVSIRRDALWIEIDIKTSVLFPSASAQPGSEARPVLRKIAQELRDLPGRIHIEGFTDNVPISTPLYPSNWELSAARAASVVRLLSEEGVAPQRLAAIGYGAHRPVASNETAAGRQQNRRVVLVLLADHDADADAGTAAAGPTRRAVTP